MCCCGQNQQQNIHLRKSISFQVHAICRVFSQLFFAISADCTRVHLEVEGEPTFHAALNRNRKLNMDIQSLKKSELQTALRQFHRSIQTPKLRSPSAVTCRPTQSNLQANFGMQKDVCVAWQQCSGGTICCGRGK